MEQHSSTMSTQLAMEQLNSTISTSMGQLNSTKSTRLFSSTVLGLCCLLGLPGNLIVLVVILRRFPKPNFTMWMMLNLASSDILCLSTTPVWIFAVLYGWLPLGRAGCKLATFFLYLSLYGNVLTVTLLSVQRYVQVLHPHSWTWLGRKGEWFLLLALWGLACALTAPAVATRDIWEKKCQRHTGSEAETVAVLIFETLLGFVVPFSTIVTCYSCLHRRVHQTPLFNSLRMTGLITSIVATFFILWIPVHILNVVDIIYIFVPASKTLLRYRTVAARVVRSFTFVNSCLDPFLYAFASRKIREKPRPSEKGERSTSGDVLQTTV